MRRCLPKAPMKSLRWLFFCLRRLFRLNTEDLALSVIAVDLPVGYSAIGSYPLLEFPCAMAVSEKGDIYMATINRGMIKLQKK